jgi:hypothetical protein
MSEGTRRRDHREIVDFSQPSTSKAAFNFAQNTNLVEKEEEPQPSEIPKSAFDHTTPANLLKLAIAKEHESESAKVIETSAICEAIPMEKLAAAFVPIQEPSLKVMAVDKLTEAEEVMPFDRLVEVPSDAAEKKEESLEINIKPEEVSQEDDIFSGVFSAPDDTESVVPSPASAIGIMSCSEESSSELESAVESPVVVPVEDNEEEQEVENEDLPPPKTDFRSMSITDEEMKLIEVSLCGTCVFLH